ncbi:unnamed protein product [Aphanomyces euteiches]
MAQNPPNKLHSAFQLSHDDESDPFWNEDEASEPTPNSDVMKTKHKSNDTKNPLVSINHRDDQVSTLKQFSEEDCDESFDDLESNLPRDDLFDTSLRDKTYKATARVVELLSLLDPGMEDRVILDACEQLLIMNNKKFLENLALVGLIPIIVDLVAPQSDMEKV